MQARLSRAAALLLLTACWFVAGCELEEGARGTGSSLERAEVVRVVDGDTIIVRLRGREERLRYIGIDAPESVTPDAPVECFGPEASDENRRLVEGKTVYLEADVEGRDRFGRLLRYVYLSEDGDEDDFVNLLLVAGGYAEAGNYPPNERHSDTLFAAEREARQAGRGLWGACD
ncbi:MAG TPA: thermonuclease family protein [Gemmataceae bacterium]